MQIPCKYLALILWGSTLYSEILFATRLHNIILFIGRVMLKNQTQGGQRQDMQQTCKLDLKFGRLRRMRGGFEGPDSLPWRSPVALAPETPPGPPCHYWKLNNTDSPFCMILLFTWKAQQSVNQGSWSLLKRSKMDISTYKLIKAISLLVSMRTKLVHNAVIFMFFKERYLKQRP